MQILGNAFNFNTDGMMCFEGEIGLSNVSEVLLSFKAGIYFNKIYENKTR